jgi:transcriptional regulator with XRE-family HTH domain
VLGVAVPNAEELAGAVALALCYMPVRLTGAEVRFIRRVLGMTGQELAAALEMDPATLWRWEHGKQDLGGWADKCIRMAAILLLRDRALGFRFQPQDLVTLRLRPRPDGVNPEIEVRRICLQRESVEPEANGWDATVRVVEKPGKVRAGLK